MLQPLLVSAGDEEQVECTYLLENMDGQMDESRHFVATATFAVVVLVIVVVVVIRQRERYKSRQERIQVSGAHLLPGEHR